MKIDCIFTATDDNPLYHEFIPMFIKLWKHFLPEADVKILYISNSFPEQYTQFKENIILLPPIENVHTAFIAQFIRLLFPCIMPYNNGVLITDMDILPMNASYYVNNIKDISDDKFVCFREPEKISDKNMYCMCYNVATPAVWKQLFQINSPDQITDRIVCEFKKIIYNGNHGGDGWFHDQFYLSEKIENWCDYNTRFVLLKDQETKFNRLDRGTCIMDNTTFENIKNYQYSDFHALRPFSKYRYFNNIITQMLTSNK